MAGCARCKKNGDVMCIMNGDVLLLSMAKNGKITIHEPQQAALIMQLVNKEVTVMNKAVEDAKDRLALYSFLAGALAQQMETVDSLSLPKARA